MGVVEELERKDNLRSPVISKDAEYEYKKKYLLPDSKIPTACKGRRVFFAFLNLLLKRACH